MAEFERGRVTKVTVEIVYPDGSTKTSEVPDIETLGAIVIAERFVPASDKSTFDISENDWKQNPSMLLYSKEGDVSTDSRGGGGIPFCTHNGCK
jgi:hypothetical protein